MELWPENGNQGEHRTTSLKAGRARGTQERKRSHCTVSVLGTFMGQNEFAEHTES